MPDAFTSQPIRMFQGESKPFDLTLVQADGSALPLAGCRLILTVRQTQSDAEPQLVKDSEESGHFTIVSADGGLATINFAPEDTAEMAPRQYVYDLWVILMDTTRHVVIDPSPFHLDAAVGIDID